MKQLMKAQLALAVMFGLGAMQAHAQANQTPISSVQDWSSRSVIQSKPLFPDELQRAGRIEDALKLYSDPRYLTAVMRRVEAELPISNQLQSSRQASGMVARQSAAADCNDRRRGHCPSTPDPESLGEGEVTRDWSNVLGGGTNGQGGRGAQGIFPAKYNFDIFAPPSCSNDFIVYTTNAAGAQSSGNLETLVSTFTQRPSSGETITIGVAGTPRSVTLTAATTPTTNLQFARGPNTTNSVEAATNATNLAAAVNLWSAQTGITATSNAGNVTFSRTTGGNSATIPITFTLNNYTVGAATDGTGAPGQATVIAFNQLYNTTCNAGHVNPGQSTGARTNDNAPNVMWSYNTGVDYIAETSPVLSFTDNGKQVAFVQRSGNLLQLVLLKGQTGQGTAGTPSAALTLSANAAAYRACVSGCYFVIPFSTTGGASNINNTPTYSSPFVDYPGDILWVGDGNGRLHKFKDVFVGNPAEVTSGGFPKTVELGLKLSSPVFDYNNSVYVGNQSGGTGLGGKLFRINAGDGTIVASSSKLSLNNTTGVRESPILDLRSQSLYAFVFNDDTSVYTDIAHCNTFSNEIDGCRAIIRLSTSFANNTVGTRQWIGRGNSYLRALYAGGFDDAFYNSVDGTGNMYITGGRPDNTFYATAWKVPINAGALGSPIRGPEFGARDRYIGSNNGAEDNLQNLSPATVIKNPNTGLEYLYVSTASYANDTGCGNGTYGGGACLYMYPLNGTWGPSLAPGASLPVTPSTGTTANNQVVGGTGGIVIDNVRPLAETGTSQIYFTQGGTTGNAIQASQSGLE